MSNTVNFYEFIGFVTFNIAVHELICVYNFFLVVFLCDFCVSDTACDCVAYSKT